MNIQQQNNEPYLVLPTVLFTEDGWNTIYEGSIMETSMYAYRVRSQIYGEHWIPKENVLLKNGGNIKKVKTFNI